MAISLGSLLIKLGLETAEFQQGSTIAEREMRKISRNYRRMASDLRSIGTKMSLAITAPLVAFGVSAGKAASDAAELQSAYDQTFGQLSRTMTNWARTTGDAMGRSTQELQKAANTFGIFFNQAAPTREEAAKLSRTFSVLAQDLSSFFNVSPDEALQKLRSGLSGESEPLRDFGVFLDAATVSQEALRLGLAKTTKEITEQDKILARASLILRDTTNAQGDVARTADGTANRVRAARAAFEELQVTVGTKLLPAVTPLIIGLTDLLNAFSALPEGVQSTVVGLAAVSAAIGPVVYLAGPLVSLIGKIRLGMFAAGGAATGLRAALLALAPTLGVVAGGLVGLGALFLLINHRMENGAQASAEYRKREEEANLARDEAARLARDLATATGEARKEAIAQAKVELALKKNLLERAKAQLIAARAAVEAARSNPFLAPPGPNTGRFIVLQRTLGVGPNQDLAEASADETSAKQSVESLTAAIRTLQTAIDAPAPTVDTGAADDGTSGKPKGRTGPSEAEIQARFLDELDSYRSQIAAARGQTARSAEEAAEFELRQVELARRSTLRAIADDADYSAVQKARLANAVETLAEEERIIVAFRLQADLESERADMARVTFDNQRDILQNAASIADTQDERKRVAIDILALEQDYRRSQLEMVIASQVASDAEKRRAQAILDSLAAIEAGERAAANRANETDVERYLRDLNLSPEQQRERIDGFAIDGLNALSDGIANAALKVKSLGDAFSTMRDIAQQAIQQVIADLIRLGIQQSINRILATAIFGGGGGGGAATGFASVLNGVSFGGARATGGPVDPGKMYLVGERGRELFVPNERGTIVPNDALRSGGGQPATYAPVFHFPGIRDERGARAAGGQAARAFRRELNGPLRGM